MSDKGLRYNEGKRKWGLLSWLALGELVKVLEFGAKKYDSWNWSKGLSFTETFECLMRHAVAWYNGEDKDPETGLSHMAHILCNAMFLMHFIVTGTGKDDRHFKDNKNDNNKEVPKFDEQAAYDALFKERVRQIEEFKRAAKLGMERCVRAHPGEQSFIGGSLTGKSDPGLFDELRENSVEQRGLFDLQEDVRSETKGR